MVREAALLRAAPDGGNGGGGTEQGPRNGSPGRRRSSGGGGNPLAVAAGRETDPGGASAARPGPPARAGEEPPPAAALSALPPGGRRSGPASARAPSPPFQTTPALPTTAVSEAHAVPAADSFRPLAAGRLQVTVVDLTTTKPLRRPYVKLTFGDHVYRTSVSDSPTGDWKEGFEFRVGYHEQLFGTCQLDVFDSGLLLDSHVGRAELVLALLENVPQIFTNYYELWDKQHSLANLSEVGRRKVYSSNIGAIRVKIAYSFQRGTSMPNIKRKYTCQPDDSVPICPAPEDDEARGQITGGDPVTRERLVQETSNDGASPIASTASDGTPGESPRPFVPAAERQRELFERDTIWGEEAYGGPAPEKDENRTSTLVEGESGSSETTATPFKSTAELAKQAGIGRQSRESRWPNLSDTWLLRALSRKGAVTRAAPDDAAPQHEPVRYFDRPGGNDDILLDDDSESGDDEREADLSLTSVDGDRSSNLIEFFGGLVAGKEAKQVLRGIHRLLSFFGQGLELRNVELLAGIVILAKFYQSIPIRHTGDIVTDMEHVETPAYFYKFAMAAYGWRGLNFFGKGNGIVTDSLRKSSDALSVIEYLRLPKNDLLGYEFKSTKVFSPRYFYCVDRANSSLVLSIRGTMSIVDSLTDLVCEYTPWKGGLVHSGVKTSAAWFVANVVPKLAQYAAENPWVSSLTVVGHSLGGATAALLVMMLVDDDHMTTQFRPGFKVKAYAYGPPCCVSRDLAEAFQPWVDTYVWETDFASGLCYGSMIDFKNMVVAAAEGARSHLTEILGVGDIFTTAEIDPALLQALKDCRQHLRTKARSHLNLWLPGRVFYMYSQPTEGNRARVVVERADAEQFTEFAIRRTMLVDHLPNTYDREFTRARETIMLEGGRRARAVPNSSSEPGGRTDPSAFLPTDK